MYCSCLQEILPLHEWWPGGAGAGADPWGRRDPEPGGADEQVVYLPALLPREPQLAANHPEEDVPLPYSFDAFGRYSLVGLGKIPLTSLTRSQISKVESRLYDNDKSQWFCCHIIHLQALVFFSLSSKCDNPKL